MTLAPRSKQRGISFFGLLILGIVLALLAIVGAKVVPTATEYMGILKAVKKAAAESSTVPEVRASFDRTASVDYITSIEGKDLEVTKNGDKVVVSFAYQREIHLAGPAYLVMKYTATSK